MPDFGKTLSDATNAFLTALQAGGQVILGGLVILIGLLLLAVGAGALR